MIAVQGFDGRVVQFNRIEACRGKNGVTRPDGISLRDDGLPCGFLIERNILHETNRGSRHGRSGPIIGPMISPPLPPPFGLRRPALLLRDLLVDRQSPDLKRLAMIEEPERFVWEMLPHAARTFSACIILLPSAMALPSAVAYLYCRILDSYEDLLPDAGDRDKVLASFVERLEAAG